MGVLLDPSGLMAEQTCYSCCQTLFFHAAVLSCVREKKKKKTFSPSTVKRLLAVDLSSRKVATLLLTCAIVASKRSLFVFTPLVFGVAYNEIDFFKIYHLYPRKIPYVSAITVHIDVVSHFPQKRKNLTL